MKSNFNNPRVQSGAALIVALILLVTLSVMAISSMNSASLDLVMAGNEQYHARAFNSAEAGIERAIATNVFNNESDSSLAATLIDSGDASNNDKYSYEITRPYGNKGTPPPALYSLDGSFSAYYFKIKSTGTSERGSISVNTQELFEPATGSDTITCDPAAASCAL